MFVDEFDWRAALSAASCPRCTHVGLARIDNDTYHTAPPRDRYEPLAIICPSLFVRCPECRVVAEWPDCEQP